MGNAGFTLVELMTSTVIAAVLGIGGVLFFRGQVLSLADQSAGLDATEGARAALDFMANEIRQAGSATTNSGSWSNPSGYCGAGLLSTSSATSLTIAWDGQSAITYDINGSTIRRTTGGVTSTLIKNAVALSFQFLRQDGSTATWPAQCTSVTNILVTVRVQTTRAPTTWTMSLASRVALRNNSTVLGRFAIK